MSIIKIAASLLHVVTHDVSELGLPKTTPITARRIVQRELDRIHEQLQRAAMALKSEADKHRREGENVCPHGIHYDNACGACIPPRGTIVRNPR